MAKLSKKEEIKDPKPTVVPAPNKPEKKESKPEPQGKPKPHGMPPHRRSMLLSLLVLLALIGATYHNNKLMHKLNAQTESAVSTRFDSKINALNSKVSEQAQKINQLKKELAEQQSFSIEQINKLTDSIQNMLPTPIIYSETPTAEILPTNHADSVSVPEILLASGALTVKGLAEDGLPFAYETEVLHILAEGNTQAQNYITSLQKYATSGITGRSMLIAEFNQIYADLSQPKAPKPAEVNPNEPWHESVLNRIKSLVVFKKRETKPSVVFPKTPDEVHQLVNAGRFAEAMNKLKTDSKYSLTNSQELNAWKAQAEQYLDFETAITGLIMNSLANLHLKELERNK